MTDHGYFLSCEEFTPAELLDQARRAADAGFDEVYVGQIGPEHEEFFAAYRDTVLLRLRAWPSLTRRRCGRVGAEGTGTVGRADGA